MILIRFAIVILACFFGTALTIAASLAVYSGLVSEWTACIGMTISSIGWAIGLTGVLNMWSECR